MRGSLLILAMSFAVPAAAERTDLPKPPPRMPVDERPTPFACTVDRVLRGEHCTFEYEPGSREPSESLARENSRKAARASRACTEAATRPEEIDADPTLRKMCEDDIARIALDQCTLEGRVAFADDDGRVVASAGPCLEELARVLSRTRTMAAVSLGCCRCLAQARCTVSGPQCNRELSDFSPGTALQSCLESSCRDSCAIVRPEPQTQTPPPPTPKARADRAADTRT
ncbi:MAG: hypothetical protein ACJ78Z_06100 [Myxococcales bacterium]